MTRLTHRGLVVRDVLWSTVAVAMAIAMVAGAAWLLSTLLGVSNVGGG